MDYHRLNPAEAASARFPYMNQAAGGKKEAKQENAFGKEGGGVLPLKKQVRKRVMAGGVGEEGSVPGRGTTTQQ